MAEFNSLRAEIAELERHEKLSLQLALTLLVGLVAATAAISSGPTLNHLLTVGAAPPILAAIAGIFFLLACYDLHAELRIALVARYINDELRVQFQRLVGEDIWRWEVYLHRQRHRIGAVSVTDRLILVLDWIRWMVYVIPIGGCLVAVAAAPLLRTTSAWQFSFAAICVSFAATIGIVVASRPGSTILR